MVDDPNYSEDQRKQLYNQWIKQQSTKAPEPQRKPQPEAARPRQTAIKEPVQALKLPPWQAEPQLPPDRELYFETWGYYQSPSQAEPRYNLHSWSSDEPTARTKAEALKTRRKANHIEIYKIEITRTKLKKERE